MMNPLIPLFVLGLFVLFLLGLAAALAAGIAWYSGTRVGARELALAAALAALVGGFGLLLWVPRAFLTLG